MRAAPSMRVGGARARLFRPGRYTGPPMDDGRVPADEQLLRRAPLVGPRPERARVHDGRLHAGHERGDVPHEAALDLQQLLGSDLVGLVQDQPDLGIRKNML